MLLAAAVIGVVSWGLLAGGNDESSAQFRTAPVKRGDIAEIVTATGTLSPVQMVNVGTQVSGQVSHIYIKLNDEVTQGQLLAEIDASLLAAEVRQMRANLETARVALEQSKRDLDRTRMLVEKDYLPKVDLEKGEQAYLAAKNNFDAGKSQVERAEVNLNYTKIFAPINGVVIGQDVTEGQTVAATYQTPNLFRIAGDLTQMKIDVAFSEADISKVHNGMAVSFTVDAFPERSFSGTVDVVNLNPSNASGVVTYNVTVLVSNEEKKLLPGMTAYVTVTLSEEKDVLQVPAIALRFAPPPAQVSGLQALFQPGMRPPRRPPVNLNMPETGIGTIHLLKDGAAAPVEVSIGKSDEVNVAVSGEGIAEGDLVITGMAPAGAR